MSQNFYSSRCKNGLRQIGADFFLILDRRTEHNCHATKSISWAVNFKDGTSQLRLALGGTQYSLKKGIYVTGHIVPPKGTRGTVADFCGIHPDAPMTNTTCFSSASPYAVVQLKFAYRRLPEDLCSDVKFRHIFLRQIHFRIFLTKKYVSDV